jgi:hypothetical protein
VGALEAATETCVNAHASRWCVPSYELEHEPALKAANDPAVGFGPLPGALGHEQRLTPARAKGVAGAMRSSLRCQVASRVPGASVPSSVALSTAMRLLGSASLVALAVALAPSPAAAQFVCIGNATGAAVPPGAADGAGASAGPNSVACGTDAIASGSNATAIGNRALAFGTNSTALGYFAGPGAATAGSLSIGTGASFLPERPGSTARPSVQGSPARPQSFLQAATTASPLAAAMEPVQILPKRAARGRWRMDLSSVEGDGVDAPRRHHRARVAVLSTT